MRLGHHRGAAFLAADDDVDVRVIVKPVQHRQKALARDQKYPLATVNAQLIGEDPPAVSRNRHCMLLESKRAAHH